jgi:hypothetical protein
VVKLFGTDMTVKWIIFTFEGHEYLVQFRDNLFRGVHEVTIFIDGGDPKKAAKVESVYPPLSYILKEIWQVYIPYWLHGIKRRRQQRNR